MKTFREFLAENDMAPGMPGGTPPMGGPPGAGAGDPNTQRKMSMLEKLLADLKELKTIPQHIGEMMSDLLDEISNGFPSM